MEVEAKHGMSTRIFMVRRKETMNRLLITYAVAVGAVAIFTTTNVGLLYAPGNYAAQDNCVVNLDGIRNAGSMKAHDNNAAEWKNIGRNANDATFIAKEGDTSGWVADGYHFAGGAFGKLKSSPNLGNSMTVQIVCDVRGSEQPVIKDVPTWPTFFGNPNDLANIYLAGTKSEGVVHFKADNAKGFDTDLHLLCW